MAIVFSLDDGTNGDSAVQDSPDTPLLQSRFWGAFKARFGWRPYRFGIRIGAGPAVPLQVLVRSLPGGQSLAYVPHGPAIPEADGRAILPELSRELAGRLPRSCFLIRFDLPWSIGTDARGTADGSGNGGSGIFELPPFRPAVMDIQPPDTVIVDLDGDDDELLARMKSKTRYNVRLAGKKGVEVAEGGIEDLGAFYRLYEETARRDRIALHGESYYRTLFELAETVPGAPRLRLLLARAEGELLAAIIVAGHGRGSTYLYGASSDVKRNLMPAYALQFAAMRLLRDEGRAWYDLFGIPPSADDPNHPMHGLYRFKTGFGGRIVRRPGCRDYPIRRLTYRLYRTAEAGRKYYYKVLKKRFG